MRPHSLGPRRSAAGEGRRAEGPGGGFRQPAAAGPPQAWGGGQAGAQAVPEAGAAWGPPRYPGGHRMVAGRQQGGRGGCHPRGRCQVRRRGRDSPPATPQRPGPLQAPGSGAPHPPAGWERRVPGHWRLLPQAQYQEQRAPPGCWGKERPRQQGKAARGAPVPQPPDPHPHPAARRQRSPRVNHFAATTGARPRPGGWSPVGSWQPAGAGSRAVLAVRGPGAQAAPGAQQARLLHIAPEAGVHQDGAAL